ncbi:2OG-Fe(II) oxygenase [Brevundimonas sp. UBA7534]|uniref:2OG-Fe(II) oxygenase n=1 Tax=Brevundimonas sp. UBA7534 TaxID=1946138 RepID=UPI0025C61E2C|nr:2OG-Fe(II) oxygenase family protein [Brevundimonas sp. UBA7534]
MTDPILRLNPALKVADYAEIYARDGMVQIPDIFEKEVAERLGEIIETSLPWSLTFYGPDSKPVRIPAQDLQGHKVQELRPQIDELIKRSGEDYGFIHFTFGMVSAHVGGQHPNHPIHPLTGFLMGPEFTQFGRALTGDPTIRWADSQATLYRPGDFIGLHVDHSDQHVQRVAAYTLGFTSRWRSDWGGQLLFHDANTGDITRGLAPRWNTLTVFKVPTLHSVAPVAPYAKGARLSVVGWFRSDQ